MFPVHAPPSTLPPRGALRPLGPNRGRRQTAAPRASLAAAAATTAVRAAGVLGLTYAGLEVKKRLLRKALREIVPALQRAGLTFWVDFGSLMSLARNGDVYEHDNDVDLVLMQPDFPALIARLSQPGVLPKGFTVDWIGKSRDLGDGLSQRWIRVYLPGKVMWADLYGAYDFGDTLRINKNSHCDLPKRLVLPLGSIAMLGSSAPAPRDVEGVLVHRYGPDWRTPKYASKESDKIEHDKPYLRLLRALGRVGLKI
ncbi:hypothetical protein HYH03_000665 [Edaphochlamys debaryana]|uniref:LicD/FKTN/FKRP nucleotidyltransferase domain-containing protein n=1 Tax=Edaphochlamys debaryana TaxID=47281 RepID=A0A835YJ54_9CHLO|nr:hypothetical protein HYH03_000665 [Edaphochlamys debaryana]|eukprot:KAG2502178.1 hypothetical protein HYH03_000665 [Edaphochlamys debaryana]